MPQPRIRYGAAFHDRNLGEVLVDAVAEYASSHLKHSVERCKRFPQQTLLFCQWLRANPSYQPNVQLPSRPALRGMGLPPSRNPEELERHLHQLGGIIRSHCRYLRKGVTTVLQSAGADPIALLVRRLSLQDVLLRTGNLATTWCPSSWMPGAVPESDFIQNSSIRNSTRSPMCWVIEWLSKSGSAGVWSLSAHSPSQKLRLPWSVRTYVTWEDWDLTSG